MYINRSSHCKWTIDLAKVDAIQEKFPADYGSDPTIYSYEFCVGPLRFEVQCHDIKAGYNPSFENFLKLVEEAKKGN